MDETPPTTVVVAGNYQQFLDWCRDNRRRPTERWLRYANEGGTNLFGLRKVHFIWAGTWYDRRDILQLVEMENRYRATGDLINPM